MSTSEHFEFLFVVVPFATNRYARPFSSFPSSILVNRRRKVKKVSLRPGDDSTERRFHLYPRCAASAIHSFEEYEVIR